MSDKQSSDASAARIAEDSRRRWEEVRQLREQVMSRQEQIIQQTRADVRRHVERMRNVRSSIVNPDVPVRPTVKAEPGPKPPSEPLKPIPNGPRFDFDSRRAAWELRRREQAEKRRADIERLNAPYQEQRRQLEEKRRQALLEQQALRVRPSIASHQIEDTAVEAAEEPQAVDDATISPTLLSPAAVAREITPPAPSCSEGPGVPRQHSLFADDME